MKCRNHPLPFRPRASGAHRRAGKKQCIFVFWLITMRYSIDMEGTLVAIEKLETSWGAVRAETFEVGLNHFRAQYLNSEGAEVWPASEHVAMNLVQGSSQIGTRLRGWV